MTAKHTRVTEASTRSPRTDWASPRSTHDAMMGLERNGFRDIKVPVGTAFVRSCGLFALRVTVANGKAALEVARQGAADARAWRPYHVPAGNEPWQVVREALELLATLDVDTPVRWG